MVWKACEEKKGTTEERGVSEACSGEESVERGATAEAGGSKACEEEES